MWQDSSSTKYASIEGEGFLYNVMISRYTYEYAYAYGEPKLLTVDQRVNSQLHCGRRTADSELSWQIVDPKAPLSVAVPQYICSCFNVSVA